MNTPRTNRAADNGHKYLRDECAALEIENQRLRELLVAVECHEFSGVECKSIGGKAWWDVRGAILAKFQSAPGSEEQGDPS